MMLLTLAALLVASSSTLDPGHTTPGDWPAWRGSHGDGVAQGSPPVEFGEDANLKWKSQLPGQGLSTPVIVGERVFVTSAVSAPPSASEPEPPGSAGRGGGEAPPVSETDFLVLAFDRADGSVLWESVARTQVPHQGTHRDGSLAAPSIVSDGERLFVSFGSYGIYAYDLDGELLWEVDLGDMDIRNAFGEGSSPVLCGDSVVVVWDHEGESFLVALEKKTGKELWRTARANGTNWSTPLVVEGEDGARIIVASTTTVAYDAASGAVLWSCGAAPEESGAPDGRPGRGEGRGEGRPDGAGGERGERGRGGPGAAGPPRGGGIIATPVIHDGVLIYGTGTRRGGSIWAVRLDQAEGDKVHESEALLWTNDRDAPRIPSPIVHDGILYALKSTSGILAALDLATGEPVYESTRLDAVADVWASPVVADGRIYIVGRDGTIEVVATGPEFATLAVNQLEDSFDASPAVAGDELFLRGRSQLYCIAETD